MPSVAACITPDAWKATDIMPANSFQIRLVALPRYKSFLDFAAMLEMAQAVPFDMFNQRGVISAYTRLHQSKLDKTYTIR